MNKAKHLAIVICMVFAAGMISSCDEELCGPCGKVSTGDSTISGDARLDGFFKAVGSLGTATATIQGDFDAQLAELAAIFEIDITGMGTADAVAEVKGAIEAEIALNVDGGLEVQFQEPKCSANVDVAVEAQASCEAKADCEVSAECSAGEVSVECSGGCSGGCTGGCEGSMQCDAELSVTGECSGTCEGSCEVQEPNMECEGVCKGTCTVAAGAECSGSCSGTCSGTCTVSVSGECSGTCEGTCDGTCTGETGEGGECNGECSGTCEGTCAVEGDAACEGTCEGTCDVECQISGEAECTGTCNGSCEFTPPDGECEGSCKGECKVEVAAEADCDGEVRCDGECTGSCSGGCEGEVTPPSCSAEGSCEASADCQASASAQASAELECTPPSIDIAFKMKAGMSGAAKAEFVGKMEQFRVQMVAMAQGMFKLRALVDADYAAEIGIESPVDTLTASIQGFISGGIGDFDVAPGLVTCVIPAFEESVTVLGSVVTDTAVTIQGQLELFAIIQG